MTATPYTPKFMNSAYRFRSERHRSCIHQWYVLHRLFICYKNGRIRLKALWPCQILYDLPRRPLLHH